MKNIYWLEQTAKDLATDIDWLSASEAADLERLRFAKRRADWLLGRWTAKLAVAFYLNLPVDIQSLANVEIRAATSGAPEVYLSSRPAPVSISLSHCAGTALCAVAAADTNLGCDLELAEARSSAFVTDYFTAEEQSVIARAPTAEQPLLITVLWSAKESALKAMHTGLRLDTRSVRVSLSNPADGTNKSDKQSQDIREPDPVIARDEWIPLQVRSTAGQVLYGWWQHDGPIVRTVVADSRIAPPISLACGSPATSSYSTADNAALRSCCSLAKVT
jgi:4'-phosphopantetheinyl transferase